MPFRTAPETKIQLIPGMEFCLDGVKKRIMKKSTCPALGLLLMALLLCTNAISQNANTWKGGTPGLENDWNCAKNWSAYRVPDAFTDVIIPDVSTTTQSPPVIQSGQLEVNSLFLETNAKLTIEKSAQLVVFDPTCSFIPKNVGGKGDLFLLNTPQVYQASTASAFRN